MLQRGFPTITDKVILGELSNLLPQMPHRSDQVGGLAKSASSAAMGPFCNCIPVFNESPHGP